MNNRIANACYKMYNHMGAFVRAEVDAFENSMMSSEGKLAEMDARMLDKWNKTDGKKRTVKKIRKELTKFSVRTAQDQFKRWTKLEEILLVKFIDGNVKAQDENGDFCHSEYSNGIPDGLTQPGYTDKWKEATAKDNGNILKSR